MSRPAESVRHVLIKFNYGFAGLNTPGDAGAKRRADYNETTLVNEAPGPATVKGPMNCTPVRGVMRVPRPR